MLIHEVFIHELHELNELHELHELKNGEMGERVGDISFLLSLIFYLLSNISI
jgi:hypothetical protein